MPSLDLIDLMKLYARRGVEDWNTACGELRGRAAKCLGTGIAEKYDQARVTIDTVYNALNANQLSFIPMPKLSKGKIDRCFFLPVREYDGVQETVAFELFLLVARTDCLAFRFEPAHRLPSTRHGYGHVQMSRTMLRKTIQVHGVPGWLPDSYPAFPLSTSDPLKMFLAMATAVHGYASGGLADLLTDIFQKAGRAVDSAGYLKELKEMLIRSVV
jgi:hypothetical protein